MFVSDDARQSTSDCLKDEESHRKAGEADMSHYAVLELSEEEGAITFATALLVVNANVVANANGVANANANSQTNANVRGMATEADLACAQKRRGLTLSDDYRASAVHAALGERGYSDVRQAALIKVLLKESQYPNGRPGVHRYQLQRHGVQFQIDLAVGDDDSVVVLDAQLTPHAGEFAAVAP